MKVNLERYIKKALYEAFESRRFEKGKVNFKKSTIGDPHIAKVLSFISKSTRKPVSELVLEIQNKGKEFDDIAAKAPILYGTIKNNIVEDTLFNMFKDIPNRVVSGAPKFDKVVFNKLVRHIKSEHDQFFPLRSFLDPKHLYNPVIHFSEDETHNTPTQYKSVSTAAASPSGEFIFSVKFAQTLLDYAYIIGSKPKGKKYVSNGGDIPDDYGYIEFIIMHEFMHYTYDDFHYQKIIPNANPKIINWVGDFRTNYLLVKSGFEQLPIGLYNDDINYDRQKTYVEMYNIVKSEFEKLNDKEKDKMKQKMDGMSDDHEPGTEEGESTDIGKDSNVDEIDKTNSKTEEAMGNSSDKSKEESKEGQEKSNQEKTDKINDRNKNTSSDTYGKIDYSKIEPKYSWTAIIKQFVSTATPKTEESYQKPSRRALSSIYTAAQIGAGAMKPGEVSIETREAKLGVIIDSSGSMSNIIETVYSNLNNLFSRNMVLQNTEFTLIKFSDNHKIYKGIFKSNKAGLVNDINDKPTLSLNLKSVFNEHAGNATNFTPKLASDLSVMIKKGYNILIFSDADIVFGNNFNELMGLFKIAGGKIFLVFDSKETYIKFREAAKMTTPNISYFS